MMKVAFLYFLCLLTFTVCAATDTTLVTPFEKSKGTQTATVDECFAYYRLLQTRFPQHVQLVQPAGQPFPMVLVKKDVKLEDHLVVMINNAIHPGEPDGVDASMMLVRDICIGKTALKEGIELRIIPFYNVAGGKRRNSHSRANQQGPAEYGFRANGQNLDLNRDLIKNDAMETRWFKKVFWYNNSPPDLFVETHVSNGADYQHTLTILPTQHNQLGGELGAYQHDSLIPAVYRMLKAKNIDACPYVNHFSSTPDSGWVEFFDSPRFSSGYAAMNNVMAVLSETHMLKPFRQRVEHTLAFLEVMLGYCNQHATEISRLRLNQVLNEAVNTEYFGVEWEIDSSRYSVIPFKGYTAAYQPSQISGMPRLYYDRNKPYERNVKFYDTYKPVKFSKAPTAYLVPLAYRRLIEEMKGNHLIPDSLPTITLQRDTSIQVEVYYIDSFKTVGKPYEGHYLHYQTQVSSHFKTVFIPGGTYVLIRANGSQKKLLVNTLEPYAPDSYFNWNFFDGILQQKEGYSDYVFEDLAAAYLKAHPELQQQLDAKKKADPAFAKNPKAQLDWVYKHSPWFENSVNLYPVFRVIKGPFIR